MGASAGDTEIVQPSEEKAKDETKKSPYTKVHTVTVCVVPPPENVQVWKTLSDIRRELKDPGYYRWPPHINLLYPFVELPQHSENVDSDEKCYCTISEIVGKLESATKQIPPFQIQLNRFGTFGGKKRGVLWLHPESTAGMPKENETQDTSPLIHLHSLLEEAFPICADQSKKQGGYTPHMTVSHFASLDDALQAQETMESSYSLTDIDDNGEGDEGVSFQFHLDRIFLLERKGDEGQFSRVAEIGLGNANGAAGVANSCQTKIFDPPQPFPGMPQSEEGWVYNERMLMKSRRRKNNKRRAGTQKGKGP